MPEIGPFSMRDFRQGVMRKSSLSPSLAPPNSVSHSINVNYDTIIGSAVVRPGTTKLGATVAASRTPLGMSEFYAQGGTTNTLVQAYSGATSTTLYYYDTSWHASNAITLSNTAKNRFAELGGYLFRVNGVDAMTSSTTTAVWVAGSTNACIATNNVVPSLIFRTQAKLLASGYSAYRSRVYFSSVVNTASSPILTWNTNPTTGDWIDINPDDGSDVTGFAETSTLVLVFKGKGMYRLDVANINVDPDNIFNIGAIGQESIVTCQGVVYFFTGQDIRSTQGDFPQQISRLGVQELIDAIPQSNWANVSGGTDGFSVYFSIGNITLQTAKTGQTTFNNVWLKFSPRDQSWSIHSYGSNFQNFSQFTTSSGRTLVGADTDGNVQTINSGVTDNAKPIYYDLQTQELEFGNRAHTKAISDQIVTFSKYGDASKFEVSVNEGDFQNIKSIRMSQRVAVADNMPSNLSGNWFTFRWSGESVDTAPVLDGFHIPSITDQGITNESH